MHKITIGFVALFGFAISAFAQENYAQWSYYKKVTVNTTPSAANVANNVSGFPLLVRLTSANADVFTGAMSGGTDLRFGLDNGTHLKYQIERWDAANQAAEIWVLMDTVYGNNSTQSFNMYWGKSGSLDSSGGKSVFDTSNGFVGVWHMDTTLTNATANPLITVNAGTRDTTGLMGRCRTFLNPTTPAQYMRVANHASLQPTQSITLSAWENAIVWSAGNASANRRIMEKGSSDNEYGLLQINDTVSMKMIVNGNTSGFFAAAPNPSIAAWHHVLGTYDRTQIKIYIDGQLIATTALTTAITANSASGDSLIIGKKQGSTSVNTPFNGLLDEVRVQNIARDSNWIKLDYKTQIAGSTVVTLGATQAPSTVTAPTITTHPANQSVNAGSAVAFAVVASGTAPFTYKWVKNNTDTVSGAITDTLKLTNVSNADSGSYKAVAKNSAGQAVSTNATLTVTAGAAILSQPSSVTVTVGSNAKFVVVISGTSPFTYKWVKNNTDTVRTTSSTSVTTDTLTLTNVQLTDNGNTYKCFIVNSAGQATSISANLSVLTVPSITQQPADKSVVVGGAASFGIKATGSATLIYKWVKNNTDTVSGATTDTLKLTNVQASDTGSYKCVVRNAAGQAASIAARLTLAPTGILQAEISGGSFSVQTSGSSMLFHLPEGTSGARVWVSDVWGRVIWSRTIGAGVRELSWDGLSRERRAAAGLYLVQVKVQAKSGSAMMTRKIVYSP